MIALALLIFTMPAYAQTTVKDNKTPKERLQDFLGETQRGMEEAGKTISDFFNSEFNSSSDEINIDGVRYMKLHTVNMFYADSVGMLNLCRQDFARRYPKAKILSVAIPQEKWIDTASKEGGKITAYKREVNCYVLGKDGTDGYINARYSFKSMREPGNSWVKPKEYWPHFDRADAIPNVHFKQLNKK